jgi:hypothetical protein
VCRTASKVKAKGHIATVECNETLLRTIEKPEGFSIIVKDYQPSLANNSVCVTFTESVHKLTSRLILTVKEVKNSFSANVLVKVRFSVVDELNNHLVSVKVQTDVTDVRGLNVGRLEEHCVKKVGKC